MALNRCYQDFIRETHSSDTSQGRRVGLIYSPREAHELHSQKNTPKTYATMLLCYSFGILCKSQLRLCLRLLQDRLHFRGLHHVAFDLQLARHKEVLRILLPCDQLAEVFV